MLRIRSRLHSRLVLGGLALWAGCGGGAPVGDAPAETTLDRIRREGVVRVGYANEAPYAYMDTESGRLTGEAPAILRVVMASLGVDQVDGVLTEFGALIPGLQAKRFDIIAAGMYITPPRCEQIAFSNPTYTIGEAFIVQAGNPLNLHSYEDVAAHETATIGVMAGAVERGYARGTGIPDERVVVFPDPPSGLDGVRAGRVDAFAGTSLTISDLMNKSSGDKVARAAPFTDPIIDGTSVRGYGAFGFRREDVALREAVNAALADFIGTPEHLALVEPFGFGQTELPGKVTAATLCNP